MFMETTETMRHFPHKNFDASKLVDIRKVTVDKNLPREKRIAEYLRQIQNPYCFKCGEFVVHARYADNGVSLEDCLRGILQ